MISTELAELAELIELCDRWIEEESDDLACQVQEGGPYEGSRLRNVRKIRDVLKRIADLEFNDRHARSNMQAVWDYLQKVSPWATSNDMDWSDEIIYSIFQLRTRAETAERFRQHVIDIIRPYDNEDSVTRLMMINALRRLVEEATP
jgi:hypothetical protein